MSAKPGAYDDLASVYHAETSLRRLYGWHQLGTDRRINTRASLNQVEQRTLDDSQAALVADVVVPETAKELGVRRFMDDARVRRASQSGGAANKARWEKIRAAQKLAKEAA